MVISLYSEMQDLMQKILDERYADQEKEKDYCIKLLEIAERENSLYCIAFAHTYLGDYYTSQNNNIESARHLDKAKRLSKENGFDDLLTRIFNLHAICYEFLGDELSAVQYYLRAFQIVQESGEIFPKAILANNIASNLAILKDFDEAKIYYVMACDYLDSISASEDDHSYVKLRVWCNFAEVLGELGELDEMKKHLLNCELLREDLGAVKKYSLCRGWCHYYALLHNTLRSEGYVSELLNYNEKTELADKIIIYEMLVSMCGIMLDLQNQDLSARLLRSIFTLLQATDPDLLRKAQHLKVLYCETFGTIDEKNEAYAEYFRKSNMLEQRINEMKTRGMKHLIFLDKLQSNLTQETTQLSKEAHLDELTQLYNRRYFNKLISKAYTSNDVKQLGIIVMDIDYFKEYNDTYGHCMGDAALKSVAQCLMEHSSENAIPSRYGGDEFVVLCTNISVDMIIEYINKVFMSLAKLNILHKSSTCFSSITLSVGFTITDLVDAQSAEQLIDMADLQLYRSKAAGRNTYRYDGISD